MRITTTTTKYVCDRCGHTAPDEMDWRGSVFGSADLRWKETAGGRAFNGDVGGASDDGKAWLCQTCREDFLRFMKGGGVEPVNLEDK